MPITDPKKKKVPSSIKVKSTTVKGKRGATTTTTTVAKNFKGTQGKKGKDLGKDFKPTKAQTAKANLAKKLQRTPPSSSTKTTIRKSKGVQDVASPNLTSEITIAPKVKQFTKRDYQKIIKDRTGSYEARVGISKIMRNKFPRPKTSQKTLNKNARKRKVKKVLSNISNVFNSPFRKTKGSFKPGCF
tara:strand:- start:272 stop:832 length:561 start_codon:yes stop_codon:yes gene_type:complete